MTGPPCCAECGGPNPIRDDGTQRLICWQCCQAIGRIVADPVSAHPAVLDRLHAKHLDVVALVHRVSDGSSPFWMWTGLWPRTGDGTLLREVTR